MVATLPTRLLALCQLTAPLLVSYAWTCAVATRVVAVALATAAVAAMAQTTSMRLKRAPFRGIYLTLVVPLPFVNRSFQGRA